MKQARVIILAVGTEPMKEIETGQRYLYQHPEELGKRVVVDVSCGGHKLAPWNVSHFPCHQSEMTVDVPTFEGYEWTGEVRLAKKGECSCFIDSKHICHEAAGDHTSCLSFIYRKLPPPQPAPKPKRGLSWKHVFNGLDMDYDAAKVLAHMSEYALFAHKRSIYKLVINSADRMEGEPLRDFVVTDSGEIVEAGK